MAKADITLTFDPGLHIFVSTANSQAGAAVETDATSSLGHVVEALGVPLTEVGELRVDGRPAPAGHIPVSGEHIEVRKLAFPQRVEGPTTPRMRPLTSATRRWRRARRRNSA